MARPDIIFRCNNCDGEFAETAILVKHIEHPKPGRDNIAVNQCPECGDVNDFTNICDEPDCHQEATCGWPTKSASYRRTCGAHMRKYEMDRAK